MAKVTRDNYKDYKYLADYRDDALEALTDEELAAQKFWLTEIYRGLTRGKLLKKIAMQSIQAEKQRRKTVSE